MSAVLSSEVLNDEIAVSVAEVLAAANREARSLGFELSEKLITVIQSDSAKGVFWRIHYGHKNPIGVRGGDLTIDVDPSTGSVIQVLKGQ